ncbi:MAG: hypothetical protein ABI432_10905 [Flavobacteriales bacterium]
MSRMWSVLELVLLAAIILMAITEFFYPLAMGKPLFGSFRKKAPRRTTTLDDEIVDARRKVDEVKDVQRKAEERLRDAEQRKNTADDLLN